MSILQYNVHIAPLEMKIGGTCDILKSKRCSSFRFIAAVSSILLYEPKTMQLKDFTEFGHLLILAKDFLNAASEASLFHLFYMADKAGFC
jgi:hypothetical protein